MREGQEAIRLKAAASEASWEGNTVRRSSSTRPSSILAMIGGSFARKRAANSSTLRSLQVTATRRLGNTEDGAAPPPSTESPSINSTFTFCFTAEDVIFRAQ